eukprot:TRINITY_DN10096_c0_g3_i1.p1 TRINITY_DN10096_c0_g3~~TRINITY_DN10096_c0_g3_i1.p1  ORF type:complete len:492 (+),score=111.39 TRINITY_DN10096_c0_g3_i1:114-1589(+)
MESAELLEAQTQLAAVEQALASSPTDADLLGLRDNLKQLIGLLSGIDATLDTHQTGEAPSIDKATNTSKQATLKLQPHEEEYRSFFANESAAVVSGQLQDIDMRRGYHRLRWNEAVRPEVECLAPLPQAEGNGHDYHQVVVVRVNEQAETCLVMFTRPLVECMVPCARFLRNTCPNTAEQCHHHHGLQLPVSDLRPFRTKPLATESRCFYQPEGSGCWHRGTVYAIVDNHLAIVMPRGSHSDEPVTLPLANVRPVPQLREVEDVSDDDDSDDDKDDINDNHPAPDPFAHNGHFGTWESHTRGIGSKLMSKLGYVPGQGLGSRQQGRVEPVPALMVPQGKSLDYIMEQRQMGRLHNVGDKPIKAPRPKRPPKPTVFDTINAATQRSGPGPSANAKADGNAAPQAKRAKITNASQAKASRADLLALQCKIEELERQKQSQQALVSRHTSHQQSSQLAYGVDVIQNEINDLKKQQRRLQTALDKHKSRQKLKIF